MLMLLPICIEFRLPYPSLLQVVRSLVCCKLCALYQEPGCVIDLI